MPKPNKLERRFRANERPGYYKKPACLSDAAAIHIAAEKRYTRADWVNSVFFTFVRDWEGLMLHDMQVLARPVVYTQQELGLEE